MKRAPVKPKEIEKEKLESVELKPSKPVKRDIPREQLENVQLRRVSIDKNVQELRQEEVDDLTKHTEDISIMEITKKIDQLTKKDIETSKQFRDTRQDTDETTLLKLDKRTEEEKTDLTRTKDEAVPWKRGPKSRDTSLDKRINTEDTSLLDISKREDVTTSTQETPIPWKRGPKSRDTSLDKRTDTDDKTVLDVQQDITEETPVTWKRGPRSRSRDLSIENKPEELIPWNQQGVKLRPSVRQPKQAQKETLETIELKPTKIVKKEVEHEILEQVDLKRVKVQMTEETEAIKTTQKALLTQSSDTVSSQTFQETEDTSLLDVQRRTEDEEFKRNTEEVLVPWKRGSRLKKPEEPISHIEDQTLLNVDQVSVDKFQFYTHKIK